ncbi:hypothetical protein RB195_025111 [Necator americanus]|uniref:Kinesin motor domain-containing protein n=1 Tax=Necator americanus TaxID=51031 RepID=A0ABR1EQX2_NECAM
MQILQEGNMRRTQESTKANRTSSRSHALLQVTQELFGTGQEDKNPRKPFALLEQYGGKMKRCSPVLNTASGVAVGEATLPIWRDHFKTLLNRQAPSAPELEHVHRPTYAVNEEPPTCRRIREMTKIIRLIWIDERIPDSWIHAVIIPLHKKLSVMDSRISLLRVMYKVVTAARQRAVAGSFLFNFAIDDIMRRTVYHCLADAILAPSEKSTKLQHLSNPVSKLSPDYGLRLRPDKCKRMWVSSRTQTGIKVDEQLIELADEFCCLC